MSAGTLFDRLWDEHVVCSLAPGVDLLHIDRLLLHDLGGGDALAALRRRGLAPRSPELVSAVPDPIVATTPGRLGALMPWGDKLIASLRDEARLAGVRLFDVGEPGQGIVHVIGPEQGISLPGTTVVCGDSHTCTHGALGALAWGIGSSEVVHVLATQTLAQRRPRTMRVTFEGTLSPGVVAKDLILALVGRLGTAGGTGYAIEYAGPVIRSLGMEGRLTLCNLSVELGAKVGLVAPDAVTVEWIRGRPHAPSGAAWDSACAHWATLRSSDDAQFDAEHRIDCSELVPQVTWGTSPEHVIGVDGRVPEPGALADPVRAQAWQSALDYMGLRAGDRIAGTRIDQVFIGSCTNSRLSDLLLAAQQVRSQRVAPHVRAWVVPGSGQVKREAEALGLHEVFKAAGFEWREPGCSLCVGANGEFVPAGARCISTSNRNFVGRQGPGARTHLASPQLAAASAIAGVIADPRHS